jgi:mono/diheme cytochrome c family protein
MSEGQTMSDGQMMRLFSVPLCGAALLVLAGGSMSFAQDASNGEILSRRWCLPCHAISTGQGKAEKPRSLQSIANTENVNFDKIVGFLLLPHAVMPNLPLRRQEIDDIAAYIAQMKK